MNITPIIFNNNYGYTVAPRRNPGMCQIGHFCPRLTSDVVSFGEGEKYLDQRTKGITYKLACSISSEAEQIEWKLLETLKDGLKDVVESNSQPNNPVAKGNVGIHGKVKGPLSIIDKALALKLYSQDEIETIGDIIRARICLRSSTFDDVEKVFKSLGKMVKRGEFKILEVENYRLEPNSGYANQKILDDFEGVCAECGQYPSIKSKRIPNGYTAIHLTVEFMGRPAEIQIMGTDMEVVKEIEDFYYKLFRCNKHLAPRYKEIEKIILKKYGSLDDFQKQALDRYVKDSYVHAKEIAGRPTKKREASKDFLPFPYFLPAELSYKYLFEMKEQCDEKAKAAKRK